MTDAEIETELARIDALSDAEILAEAEARGVDTVAEAERLREMLLKKARETRAAIAKLMADPQLY